MCLFADDTNVFLTDTIFNDLESTMNKELCQLSDWLQSNKLSLNIKKTHYMIFTPPRNKSNFNLDIKIDNCSIDRVMHTKFLGVIVDSQLSWKQHVNYIKGKIHKSIGIINRAKHFLNKDSLITLYYVFWVSVASLLCKYMGRNKCYYYISNSKSSKKSSTMYTKCAPSNTYSPLVYKTQYFTIFPYIQITGITLCLQI